MYTRTGVMYCIWRIARTNIGGGRSPNLVMTNLPEMAVTDWPPIIYQIWSRGLVSRPAHYQLGHELSFSFLFGACFAPNLHLEGSESSHLRALLGANSHLS